MISSKDLIHGSIMRVRVFRLAIELKEDLVEGTHTQERYRQERSQTERFVEKMEEHSPDRFTEFLG